MENKVKKLQYDELLEILRQYDTESIFDKVNMIPDSEDLHEAHFRIYQSPFFCQTLGAGHRYIPLRAV